jgi:GNAT superfamily N-acetyltransferase
MTDLQSQEYFIVNASSAPQHLDQLRDWFESEWGHIDPFEGTHLGFKVPRPILALDAQKHLAGGLAFSSFRRPGGEELSVWINALLIAPEHRRMGLASRLIEDAHDCAAGLGVQKLYASTDVPALYEKLAWRILEVAGADTILVRDVTG